MSALTGYVPAHDASLLEVRAGLDADGPTWAKRNLSRLPVRFTRLPELFEL